MDLRIADPFNDSMARLTGDEQKAVKTMAFDPQLSPAHRSLSLHRIEHSKDKSYWSVRAGSEMRIIVHKMQSSLMLCYVDHHDKAYDWAARRKLVTHPATGAAQLVEMRETASRCLTPSAMPGASWAWATFSRSWSRSPPVSISRRRKPELIKATRKRRIAKGSGVQVKEVNRMLKEVEQMQDMMKKMKRMGGMKDMPKMPF